MKLKQARELKKIQQGDFAKQIGVSQTTVSLWEHEKMIPSYANKLKVECYLGMFLDWPERNSEDELDETELNAWARLIKDHIDRIGVNRTFEVYHKTTNRQKRDLLVALNYISRL